jgi:hypothetical protein
MPESHIELIEKLIDIPVGGLNPMEQCLLAAAVVKDHIGDREGAVKGVLNCPICKEPDSLHFQQSGYNGHVAAQCETDDCVHYRE